MNPQIQLLYRDDFIVAVSKPSGLAVHRGLATDDTFALDQTRDLVGHHVYPVHRLDRATSGVLLFGATSASAHALAEQFEAHTIQKRYLALVRGRAPRKGVINHPIPKCEDGPRVPAVTHFRSLANWERYSWVEAIPQTGRMHQIRRHFKHLSLPLIGDVNYGKGEHNRYFRETFGLCRLALHAAEIVFMHPGSGETMRVQAPLADDLRATLVAMSLDTRVLGLLERPMEPIAMVDPSEFRVWQERDGSDRGQAVK